MSVTPIDASEQFWVIASHFASRRTDLLREWREGVLKDRNLPTADALPRSQFYDHVPQLLRAFEKILFAASGRAPAQESPKDEAASHGLQRWQQGYDLREVTVEWGRLHACLFEELERCHQQHPEISNQVMADARRELLKLCNEGITESTSQYFKLQQLEASGHVNDLVGTLKVLRQLENQRAELWRQAAHDLRGSLGVVVNTTEILKFIGPADPSQNEIFPLLHQGVASLQTILDDVLSLARLQAGHEQLEVKPIDVTKLVQDLCDNFRQLATDRGLFLKVVGPESLHVSGDSAKILRITQNLLINALKYTSAGGITVSWGESLTNDPDRWWLAIQDTGPGFHAGPGAPLIEALENATEESKQIDNQPAPGEGHNEERPSPKERQPDTRVQFQGQGEGIGLSIVKRLCELLMATVEVESNPNAGTCFKMIFPKNYPRANK